MGTGFEIRIEGEREYIVVGIPAVDEEDLLAIRYPIEIMSYKLRNYMNECARAELRRISGPDKGLVFALAEDLTLYVGTDIKPIIQVCGYYYDLEDEKNEFEVVLTPEIEEPERKRIYEYTLAALGRAMSLVY